MLQTLIFDDISCFFNFIFETIFTIANSGQNYGNFLKSLQHKMAGIGADCPTMNPDIDSCLRSGTIIASYSVPGLEYQSCSFAPWLSGVVCCKDKPKG